MRGDLLFYRAQPHSPLERFVAWATKGPFSHVAIDAGDGTVIEAQAGGVAQVQFSSTNYPRIVRHSLIEPNLDLAFHWAKGKIGAKYGWGDIGDVILHKLHINLYFGRPNEFDCSDLAACFAAIATNDPVLMSRVLDMRQDITPNDLARYYKVL